MIITDKLRVLFSNVIKKIAVKLVGLGISANTVSLLGFIGNVIAAALISQGYLISGGVLAGVNSLLDGIDGAVAKEGEGITPFGSFLDSTLDRFSEYALFIGIGIYYYANKNSLGIMLTLIAFGGSILVSYIRAKSEAFGLNLREGLLTRVERLIVLVVSLLFRKPIIGLIIISVFGNITAFQRFLIVKKALEKKGAELK